MNKRGAWHRQESQPRMRRHVPRPYQHPVALDHVKGRGRPDNLVVNLLVDQGHLPRSYFTKRPATERGREKRARDMRAACRKVIRDNPHFAELIRLEAERRWGVTL